MGGFLRKRRMENLRRLFGHHLLPSQPLPFQSSDILAGARSYIISAMPNSDIVSSRRIKTRFEHRMCRNASSVSGQRSSKSSSSCCLWRMHRWRILLVRDALPDSRCLGSHHVASLEHPTITCWTKAMEVKPCCIRLSRLTRSDLRVALIQKHVARYVTTRWQELVYLHALREKICLQSFCGVSVDCHDGKISFRSKC